jgi:hypothetical protein
MVDQLGKCSVSGWSTSTALSRSVIRALVAMDSGEPSTLRRPTNERNSAVPSEPLPVGVVGNKVPCWIGESFHELTVQIAAMRDLLSIARC